MDAICYKLIDLGIAERSAVLSAPTVACFPDEVLQRWVYLVPTIGMEGFVFNTEEAAELCGYSSSDARTMITDAMKKFGDQGVDWTTVEPTEVFRSSVNQAPVQVQLHLPWRNEVVKITRGDNAKKFYQISNDLMRKLMLRADTDIGKQFRLFLLAIHDKMLELARAGAVPVATMATPMRSAVDWSTRRHYLDYLTHVMKAEMTSCEFQMEFLSKHDLVGDRDKIEIKDRVHGIHNRHQRNVALVQQEGFDDRMLLDKPAPMRIDAGAAEAQLDNPDEFIDHVSRVERVLGRTLSKEEVDSFSRALAKAYRKEYNEDPPKAQ